MASSRIFVRGLPPSLTEESFKKHFSSQSPVTDIKLLPHRRIGYVGFGSAEDAAHAVKYFNRSFIRTSRISVELADTKLPKAHTNPTLSRDAAPIQKDASNSNPLKRKREHVQNGAKVTGADENSVQAPTKPLSPPTKPQLPEITADQAAQGTNKVSQHEASDADWMRSHTSRLLGLVDDDEEEGGDNSENAAAEPPQDQTQPRDSVQQPTPPPDDHAENTNQNEEFNPMAPAEETADHDEEAIRESRRLFIRNLSYNVTEADIENHFQDFGPIQEVYVPLNLKSGEAKGFAFVLFNNSDDAVEAFRKSDGSVFHGRLLHVLPAAAKRETKLDEYAIAKLPIKKQKQIQKRNEAASSTFSWNSLFMSADNVLSSISDRLGVSKSEILDPSSSDAAVKQAQAETHVIQETKKYFTESGVNLNAFKSRERGDTAIVVKNFPYGTKAQDLKQLFATHGEVSKVLMPPSGTIAIVEFAHAFQARSAFGALAYRKYGDSVLFLEKAPKGLFDGKAVQKSDEVGGIAPKQDTADLLQADDDDERLDTSTLFVRNLNFATTNERFRDVFQPLDGFISARIKTKTDPKRPGEILSMGFGFIEFRSAPQARAALAAMNGYNLDGHQLLVKASHKGHDAAEERKKLDDAKKRGARKSKIVIKNLPFEASKKDVRNLFKSYGQLRAIRVPKKFDNSRKGFAFAEFANPREAENAMEALSNTHLLGRRLVLDYAAGDVEDPEAELEQMQRKIEKQSQNMSLQRLASRSERKKIRIGDGKSGGDDE